MILVVHRINDGLISKPRASGDDPSHAHPGAPVAHVNPARAGMILLGILPLLSLPRKPRASGDDPRVSKTPVSITGKPRASGDDPKSVLVNYGATK